MKKPKVVELIKERALQEVESEWRPARIPGVFRGSELGDCSRAIQYAVTGNKAHPVNAELALLFSDGHMHHEALRARLKSVGVVTNIEYGTARKYVVPVNGQDIEVVISGTTDGIFEGQFVFDIKSINMFGFKALKNKGEDYLIEKYPHYIDQIQAYLELFDKEWGFLLFKCKNSSALLVFWIQRNKEHFQKILNKVAKIHWATLNKKMMKRPYSKSSWECKICPYRKLCRGVAPQERSW